MDIKREQEANESSDVISEKLSKSEQERILLKQLLDFLLKTNIHKGIFDAQFQFRKVLQQEEGNLYEPEKNAQSYSFSAEKLILILRIILENSDLKKGDSVMLPFAGMGSLPGFLTSLGFNVMGSDILYQQKGKFNYDPKYNIGKLRAKILEIFPDIEFGEADFFQADAQNLPISSNSIKMIFAAPPYNVNCKVDSNNELALFENSVMESLRVLAEDGKGFYVIPRSWLSRVSRSINFSILCEDLTNNPNAPVPVSLILIQKNK